MFLRRLIPALIWALFIVILCGIPGRDIPHISFLELLEFDKWVHAAVFFVLVVLLISAMRNEAAPQIFQRYPLIISAFFSIAYGGILEILQEVLFVERSADVLDFIANSVGSLMALVFVYWNTSRKKKVENAS